MAFRDDLLPEVDDIRAIPGEFGLRRYRVWVVTTTFTGSRPGMPGAQETRTEVELLVNGQPPKVRNVRSRDVIAGIAEASTIELEIGPVTPEFAGGGHYTSDLVLSTPQGVTSTVTYLVKGPGMPPSGLVCKRVFDNVDKPFRYMIHVAGTGRKNTP